MPNSTDRHVVLCNDEGVPQGVCPIPEAHEGEGQLHLAFSVFVFRNDGSELLIQQRSEKKPLFPLIWANTCCSHPQDGDDIVASGEKRLQEECGFSLPLYEFVSFVYKAPDPHGNGTEFEHDTILLGQVSDTIELNPDPSEIAQLRWVSIEELQHDMRENPTKYAPWFHLGLKMILDGTMYE